VAFAGTGYTARTSYAVSVDAARRMLDDDDAW
jgi:hypothetical protein